MSGEAVRLARRHYENFPVLSRFVPPELRHPLATIYAFARVTDDLGDEGSTASEQRLAALARWEKELDAALSNGAALHGTLSGSASSSGVVDPVLADVARTIHSRGLPVEPFRAIIHANRLDQLQSRYPTYDDLLGYCAFSANPVGRIVLLLFGSDDPRLLRASDAICTGLQLANHWQGIGEDLRLRDRLYVPREDLDRFGVSEEDLRGDRPSRPVRRLIGFLIDRTRHLLDSGASLPEAFERRSAAVLRLFWRGGRAILSEIERHPDDLLHSAIRVSRTRALLMLGVEGLRWIRG